MPFQDYARSMLSPDQTGSEGCPPKICADVVIDEDEGQVYQGGVGSMNRSYLIWCCGALVLARGGTYVPLGFGDGKG
jgi:hypothetical protein